MFYGVTIGCSAVYNLNIVLHSDKCQSCDTFRNNIVVYKRDASTWEKILNTEDLFVAIATSF